jgi:hypothetical protein
MLEESLNPSIVGFFFCRRLKSLGYLSKVYSPDKEKSLKNLGKTINSSLVPIGVVA